MTRSTLALVLSLAALGCGSSARRTTVYAYHTDHDPVTNDPAHITQGAMPSGETWSGSYSSPQIGEVYLDQTGDVVTGTYEYDRAACHARGTLEGRANGNLMTFTWTESQAECGRLTPMRGRGYFLFWKDGSDNARINGEWGLDDNESGGGPWHATRDRVRRTPQRRSTAPSSGGGVFEDANGAQGSSGTSGSSTSTTP